MSNVFTGAARDGDLETVAEMLANGHDPNTPNDGGGNALPLAAENGHVHVVDALVCAGADTEAGSKTALMHAASRGHVSVVERLLAASASIDATDQNGQSALIWATAYARSHIVRLLIANGADTSIKDNFGNDALSVAQQTGNAELQAVLAD